MLNRNERGLRREKWAMWILWLFAVAYMLVYLLASSYGNPTPERTWLVCLAGAWLIVFYGGLEIVKHFVNRSRVEVLKEVKQLEMRVLELQESLRGRGSPSA